MPISERTKHLQVPERSHAHDDIMKYSCSSSLALAATMMPALLSTVDGFAPSLRLPAMSSSSHRSITRHSVLPLRMGYLNDAARYAPQPEDDARSIAQRASVSFSAGVGSVMPDKNYVGFVDWADGFDGGDAQMGVIGDGNFGLDKFDSREVLLGDGSASEGSVQVSLHSGPKPILPLAMHGTAPPASAPTAAKEGYSVQRQQYENWSQQQLRNNMELKSREQVERADNTVFQPPQEVIPGSSTADVFASLHLAPCQPGRVDAINEFDIRGAGTYSVFVEPASMVSEHFLARLTPDSPDCFSISDTESVGGRSVSGQLPRRGTPQEIIVRFDPDGPVSQATATLVLDAEDGTKWTYRFHAST